MFFFFVFFFFFNATRRDRHAGAIFREWLQMQKAFIKALQVAVLRYRFKKEDDIGFVVSVLPTDLILKCPVLGYYEVTDGNQHYDFWRYHSTEFGKSVVVLEHAIRSRLHVKIRMLTVEGKRCIVTVNLSDVNQ